MLVGMRYCRLGEGGWTYLVTHVERTHDLEKGNLQREIEGRNDSHRPVGKTVWVGWVRGWVG